MIPWGPDDHRLAAAEVEPGDRGLEAHAPGEAEHVGEGVVLGGVGVEAGAAENARPSAVEWMAMMAFRPEAESWL